MKKIIIITYYWPPAGGPGVQRWLKFVKYLKDFDVEPIVYIPQNPNYPIVDKSLLEEIPKDIKIISHPIVEPYSISSFFSKSSTSKISSGIIPNKSKQSFLQKFLLFIRGNFFIPDARKFWIKPSVKYLTKFIIKEGVDTIITTGPPHSLHLIGNGIKKKIKVNWIADFRDPWTQIGYHKELKLTKYSRKKHLELESLVLDNANHIITTSFKTQEEFLSKTKTPVTVITNGYDSEIGDLQMLDSKFLISHIGSLLSARNPEVLWEVLSQICNENIEFASHFKLNLTGAVSEDVINSINRYGLSKYLNLEGYVSHDKAIELQRKSQLLLLIEIDSEETKGIIPGKLFEYLAAKRPILAIGPDNWDAAKIINETNAGATFLYKDAIKLKEYILDSFELFKTKNLIIESKNTSQYHRKMLTQKLANLIKR